MLIGKYIFVIFLNLFVFTYFRGTCSSIEMLKGYMARESLRTPVLNQNPVLPQASRLKLPVSQKNSLDLRTITRFKIFALKFAVLPEIMYLFTLFPKNLYIICKFAKIDHVEAQKISY